MKEETAIMLLGRVMGWKNNNSATDTATYEVPFLLALSQIGYDEYSQFNPGMRFIDNLVKWLKQFKFEERQIAFQFIRDRVLFITRIQMEHLIEISYDKILQPILIKQVSDDSHGDIPYWKTSKILSCNEFKILSNKSLFLGLSDGSHMDIFRRYNLSFSHEQMFRTHEIIDKRVTEMIDDLEKRIKRITTSRQVKYFRNIFLIDDFSASGTSYLRKNGGEPFEGKLAKFHNLITEGPMRELIDLDDLHIHLILYVATKQAHDNILSRGKTLFGEIPFDLHVVYLLSDDIKFNKEFEKEFSEIIKDRAINEVVDEHWKKARKKYDYPYLGYDECALPLILHHNTPNNSLPILWRNDLVEPFKGLFPRISRHQ